jgi:hypothetical protein
MMAFLLIFWAQEFDVWFFFFFSDSGEVGADFYLAELFLL